MIDHVLNALHKQKGRFVDKLKVYYFIEGSHNIFSVSSDIVVAVNRLKNNCIERFSYVSHYFSLMIFRCLTFLKQALKYENNFGRVKF
jgi:hypothetical protein